MNILEKILYGLQSEMTTPTNYGWFHILFIVIAIVSTVLLCKYFKNCSTKTFNLITLIGWGIIFSFEILKQLIFSFNYSDGVVSWDYAWYAFPYQLCSTPLYILPFVFLLKDGKIRDAMLSYIMTFSFFGGLVVYLYPNDVFQYMISINIQTMVHHGIQVVLGIFFMVHNRNKLNFKFWIKSIYVFSILAGVALLLDISIYHIFKANEITDTFNMFFISPYFNCTLPILSLIYPNVPYIIFLLIYLLGFTLISYLIYLIQKSIYKLVGKITYANKQKVSN